MMTTDSPLAHFLDACNRYYLAPEWPTAQRRTAVGDIANLSLAAIAAAVDPEVRRLVSQIAYFAANYGTDPNALPEIHLRVPLLNAAVMAGEQSAKHTPEVDSKPNGKGKRVNEKMLAFLTKNPESLGWSAQDWADKFGCSKSTVHGTLAWKRVKDTRTIAKASAASQHKGDVDDDDDYRTGAGGGRRVIRNNRSNDDD